MMGFKTMHPRPVTSFPMPPSLAMGFRTKTAAFSPAALIPRNRIVPPGNGFPAKGVRPFTKLESAKIRESAEAYQIYKQELQAQGTEPPSEEIAPKSSPDFFQVQMPDLQSFLHLLTCCTYFYTKFRKYSLHNMNF